MTFMGKQHRGSDPETETQASLDGNRGHHAPVSWSNHINLGQILNGGTILVAVVGSYYAQSIKIERQEMRLGAQQDMIARIEKVTDSLATSQNSIAQTLAVLTTKVEERRKTP